MGEINKKLQFGKKCNFFPKIKENQIVKFLPRAAIFGLKGSKITKNTKKSYPSAHDIIIAVQGNLIHIVCSVSMCSRYGQLSNYFLMSVWYNRVETGNLDHPLSYHVTVLCGYGQDNLEKLAIVHHICAGDD